MKLCLCSNCIQWGLEYRIDLITKLFESLCLLSVLVNKVQSFDQCVIWHPVRLAQPKCSELGNTFCWAKSSPFGNSVPKQLQVKRD